MQFIISNSAEKLREILNIFPAGDVATVEAEYGDEVVEGGYATLAHHGPRSGNPAPCLFGTTRGPATPDIVGLSHLDLDALGGCMALMRDEAMDMGVDGEFLSFWRLAAFVDVNGPHRLSESGASAEDLERLYAFWAWAKDHRVVPPRDGSVVNVTGQVYKAKEALLDILDADEALLEAGRAFRGAEDVLDAASWRGTRSCEGGDGKEVANVLRRESDQFVNHLYAHRGVAADAVVARNTVTGAVTVSFAGPPPGGGAVEIVQRVWGPLAGGHAGIAGCPRGHVCTDDEFDAAIHYVALAFYQASPGAIPSREF